MEKETQEFSGLSERKYVLLAIKEKVFIDNQSNEVIPYYEIWVDSLTDNRVLNFKPANNKGFASRLEDFKPLIGKQVGLVISAKERNGQVLAVIDNILPIL